jgi:hypothetical protein
MTLVVGFRAYANVSTNPPAGKRQVTGKSELPKTRFADLCHPSAELNMMPLYRFVRTVNAARNRANHRPASPAPVFASDAIPYTLPCLQIPDH